ncbi:MAG: ABC transporter ATP-binding protein [Candidatus Omnitrophota bacterium]
MIEARGLTCGYDSSFFLKDINLKVKNGEIMGIIGPNGSGKTTFLRAMTRILKPRSGTISFRERDIWTIKLEELAKMIAVVSQRSETAMMSVEEYVLLGRIPHHKRLQLIENKRDMDIARRSMELTGTLKIKDHLIDEISGGERQLALIARALTQEPDLLLLDEPTTHLDISHQVMVLNLIKRLNSELGLTVIMVLHDLNLASEYCHRLILLNEGRVRKIGSPEEVIDYRIIEEVYKTLVVVKNNPVSSRPHVFVVSEEKNLRPKIEE